MCREGWKASALQGALGVEGQGLECTVEVSYNCQRLHFCHRSCALTWGFVMTVEGRYFNLGQPTVMHENIAQAVITTHHV